MITSIGHLCFLQNWLYAKSKKDNTPYNDNILGRITAYPPDWDKDIVLEKLQTYDQFYDNFQKTGSIVKEEFISEKEGCRIHWNCKMDFKQMDFVLKNSDVILYNIPRKPNQLQIANEKFELLKKLNPKFKFICFSMHIQNDLLYTEFPIYKLPNNIFWIDNYHTIPINNTPNEVNYIKGWFVEQAAINVLDKVWEQIKFYA